MAERGDALREREAVEPAPGKVNLALRVLGRRDDGYHDIETLLVPLDLADTVVVRGAKGGGRDRGEPRSFTVAAPGDVLDALPAPSEDLAWRAADAFERAAADVGEPVRITRIHVDKRIPVAAGLGGGSADAAAVLRAANRLFGGLLDGGALEAVASSLGSDVPAMLSRVPVVARGRGELVEPAGGPSLSLVVVPIPLAVRAADAYEWWDLDGGATGPALDAVLAAAGSDPPDPAGLAREVFDDLQPPVARRHPAVADAVAALEAAGALAAIMSGSGPTVFGVARDREHAAEVADSFARAKTRDQPEPMIVSSVGSA